MTTIVSVVSWLDWQIAGIRHHVGHGLKTPTVIESVLWEAGSHSDGWETHCSSICIFDCSCEHAPSVVLSYVAEIVFTPLETAALAVIGLTVCFIVELSCLKP